MGKIVKYVCREASDKRLTRPNLYPLHFHRQEVMAMVRYEEGRVRDAYNHLDSTSVVESDNYHQKCRQA